MPATSLPELGKPGQVGRLKNDIIVAEKDKAVESNAPTDGWCSVETLPARVETLHCNVSTRSWEGREGSED